MYTADPTADRLVSLSVSSCLTKFNEDEIVIVIQISVDRSVVRCGILYPSDQPPDFIF